MLIRRRVGKLSRMLALDGVIGACAIAGVCAAFVLEPVLETATGTADREGRDHRLSRCWTSCSSRWSSRPSRSGAGCSRAAWALLAAGLLAFALTDAIYYAQVAAGTYVDSRYLDIGWLVAMLLVGVAAWQPDPKQAPRASTRAGASSSPRARSPRSRSASRSTPTPRRSTSSPWRLACAALLAVIVRMVATFRENLRILDAVRHESRHRRADRPRQPPPPARRPRGAARRRPAPRARPLRPQRLQALQRHLRPPGRRRAAEPPRRPARVGGRRPRPRLPDGRRRVLRAARRPRRRERRDARRAPRWPSAARASPSTPPAARSCSRSRPTRPPRRCGSPTRACTSRSAAGARPPRRRASSC